MFFYAAGVSVGTIFSEYLRVRRLNVPPVSDNVLSDDGRGENPSPQHTPPQLQ